MTPNFSKTIAPVKSETLDRGLLSYEAVDLFCGCGGATSGLLEAGLNVVLSVDLDLRAVRAHRAIHPNITTALRNVSHVRPSELQDRIVWASPSCKPYSMANTSVRRGVSHPEYYPLTRLLRQSIGAKALIIENVPGLLWSKEGREELTRLETEALALGVPMQVLKLRASDVGLEQNRLRVFVVLGVTKSLALDKKSPVQGLTTVTTRSRDDLESMATAQGMDNPTNFLVSDYRSGRRARPGALVSCLKPYQARRVLGNANPPAMTAAIVRLVLEGLDMRHQRSSLSQNSLFVGLMPIVSSRAVAA